MRDMAAKAAYDMEHKKETYFRVGVDFRREDIEVVRKAAAKDGKPLSTWIKDMVYRRCEELGIAIPSRAADNVSKKC